MTLGSFCLIKNEINFIAEHLRLWTPYLDSMVFYDGGSTDGTLEVLANDKSGKVKVFDNKDPKDLTDDYVKLSNEALHELDTDIAMFLHPDFFPENPEVLQDLPEDIIAGTFKIRTFAGNPGEQLYEIKGRGDKWKDIYRLNNPDLGAHYHGHYGAFNEDIYFSEITGTEHANNIFDFNNLPYPVFHSDLIVHHYSDVRPYNRRLERMKRCLINQGRNPEVVDKIAKNHPRVTLKDGQGLYFFEAKDPIVKLGGK